MNQATNRVFRALFAVLFTLGASSCTSNSPTAGEEAESEAEAEAESEGSLDCDDGIDCTADQPRGSGCDHQPLHARCDAPQICDPAQGCTQAPPCRDAADCADLGPCSISRCDRATSTCQYDNIDNDADGYVAQGCGGDDCDDSDYNINPGPEGPYEDACYPAASGTRKVAEWERCDGRDNNCDGKVDNLAILGQPCQGRDRATDTLHDGIMTCSLPGSDGTVRIALGCVAPDGVQLWSECDDI